MGVVTGPIFIAGMAVAIGVIEGIAVFEAEKVRPNLEAALNAARNEQINIHDVLDDEDKSNFLYEALLAKLTWNFPPEYSRLQNDWKQDHYLHVEYGQVEGSRIDDVEWASAHWAEERIQGTPSIRLRNS